MLLDMEETIESRFKGNIVNLFEKDFRVVRTEAIFEYNFKIDFLSRKKKALSKQI